MSSPVSLYMSGKYNDKIIFEDENQITIDYCGQNSGIRDHLICDEAFVFVKEKGVYKLLGNVYSVKYKGKENGINVFTLVIQKEIKIIRSFRIKNDICSHFGWPQLNRFECTHGIIPHK